MARMETGSYSTIVFGLTQNEMGSKFIRKRIFFGSMKTYRIIFSNFETKTTIMADNFFESSTAAVGTIITIVLLAVVFGIVFLG